MILDKVAYHNIIKEIPIIDTHSHLNGKSLSACNFWDIGEYGWFLRELIAAGYPDNRYLLDEETRIVEYVKAFRKTMNTTMNWAVRLICEDLYGIEILDEKDIKAIDMKIKKLSNDSGWIKEIVKKSRIKKIFVNEEKNLEFRHIPEVSFYLPRMESDINKWINEVLQSENKETLNSIKEKIDLYFEHYTSKNCSGVLIPLKFFAGSAARTENVDDIDLKKYEDVYLHIMQLICSIAENYKFNIQFFMGMDTGWEGNNLRSMRNDPERILKLYYFFEKFKCNFELVNASNINTLDIVQAVLTYPGVYAGGLWWMSFRKSIFMDTMQKRFEAIPACKSSFIVSDAYCLEWCFAKISIIKNFMCDFLFEKIQNYEISSKDSIQIAENWLYASTKSLYKV